MFWCLRCIIVAQLVKRLAQDRWLIRLYVRGSKNSIGKIASNIVKTEKIYEKCNVVSRIYLSFCHIVIFGNNWGSLRATFVWKFNLRFSKDLSFEFFLSLIEKCKLVQFSKVINLQSGLLRIRRFFRSKNEWLF